MAHHPEEDEHERRRTTKSRSSAEGSGRRRAPTSSRSSASIDSGGSEEERHSSRHSSSRTSGERPRAEPRRSRRENGSGGSGPRRAKSAEFGDFKFEEDKLATAFEEMGYDDATPDMGYGDETPDMGYGDATPDKMTPTENPVRSRRQRRCSIAEVTASTSDMNATEEADYGYGAPERPRLQRAGSSDFNTIGASATTISNIAIPMANTEDGSKRKNRRGSMFGAISRNVASSKEPEPEKTKKPGADRDRQRSGTLLDRVGAGDTTTRSRNGVTSSYSDRLHSK